MEDKRAEFTKLRRMWMKEHGWKGFVCARCGRFSKSAHLHHIQELIYGGENTPDNLIPLCSDCHHELDFYSKDYPFEQFLVTMPSAVLPLTHEMTTFEGAELFPTRSWLGFCASVYRAVNLAKTSSALEDMDMLASDLLYEQNEFFSKYPYSDEDWRAKQLRATYGNLAPISTGICKSA